ncbi:hypothetical protein CesoFtcFv8_018140 [Champsocephalus esox]|uniref:Uncharacterized protein n=1 Tax=Champsocephalus esox TaxID=159716 RepID=A0AAN8GN93_9TELE|nr:hypothetical protein CesoFtcFv8_018140 [Champsocephalus esox]
MLPPVCPALHQLRRRARVTRTVREGVRAEGKKDMTCRRSQQPFGAEIHRFFRMKHLHCVYKPLEYV